MTEPTGPAPRPEPPVDAGPAPGIAYADLVPRVVAIVIDVIIVGFIYGVVVVILAALGGWGAFLLGGIINVLLSVAYFVYLWTRERATLGQRIFGLETVNATDGATLARDQALRRWLFLWGPGALAQVFGYGAGTVVGPVGWLVAVLALLYELYLLYTASQSPRRQGFHDVQAATVVVRRAR